MAMARCEFGQRTVLIGASFTESDVLLDDNLVQQRALGMVERLVRWHERRDGSESSSHETLIELGGFSDMSPISFFDNTINDQSHPQYKLHYIEYRSCLSGMLFTSMSMGPALPQSCRPTSAAGHT